MNPLPEGGIEVDLDGLTMAYPLKGRLLSDFGETGSRINTGIDISPEGTQYQVRAALGGVVRVSSNQREFGNTVVIWHSEGFETQYSNNSRNLVKVNSVVKAGDVIALVGRGDGKEEGHLHFELLSEGMSLNPNLLLDVENKRVRGGKLFIKKIKGRIMAYNGEDERKEIENIKINERELKMTSDVAPKKEIELATDFIVVRDLGIGRTNGGIIEDVAVSKGPEGDTERQSTKAAKTIPATRLESAQPTKAAKTIPATRLESAQPTKAATSSTSFGGTAGAVYHTMGWGDTIYALSRRYGTAVDEIARINGISLNKTMFVGEVVRVK